MEKDILTTKEAALFLEVPRYTVYYMAEQDHIHGFKDGGQWRFRKSELNSWQTKKRVPSLPGKVSKGPR